jgi:hypothetical protein
MPYKFNETRRHKIPKARYRVANWPEYDAALVRRGSITVWPGFAVIGHIRSAMAGLNIDMIWFRPGTRRQTVKKVRHTTR